MATGPRSPVVLGPVIDLGPPRFVSLGGEIVVGLDTAMRLQARPLAALDPAANDGLEPGSAALVAPALVGPAPLYAYWIAAGRLLRQQIGDGKPLSEPETLAADATDGVAVVVRRVAEEPSVDVAIYVGQPQGDQGDRPARLWVEGHGSLALSREGGNVTAVGLVARGGRRLVALSLDGRMGMSLLHAVPVDVDPTGRARPGEDRVVYVGGSAERNTRFDSLAVASRALVLLPIANDAGGFGLASLLVPEGPGEAVPLWRTYPNGLDPAPVSAGSICGLPHVAIARPEAVAADAAHVVELAAVGPDGALGPAMRVGRAGRVAQVVVSGGASWAAGQPAAGSAAGPAAATRAGRSTSQAATSNTMGGWIAYAADTGLWAHALQCGQAVSK